MKTRLPVVPLTGLLLMSGIASGSFAADSAPACNMMGREVALRAAEQLDAAIDADKRIQLAAIAEEVCLQYRHDRPAMSMGNAGNGAQQDAATDSSKAGDTGAEDEDDGFFSLRRIDPKDRVQRPGLKRP